MKYEVRAGIWKDGPVAFIPHEAVPSFEEHGLFINYGLAEGRPLGAWVEDGAIYFFAADEGDRRMQMPVEKDPLGFAARLYVKAPYLVRSSLFDTTGEWIASRGSYLFRITTPRPHAMPYPDARAQMDRDQIIRDLNARVRSAKLYTGRGIDPGAIPEHYLAAMTATEVVQAKRGDPIDFPACKG